LESLAVCLAKQQRWAEAVRFGRKACAASQTEAAAVCAREASSAACCEARVSSGCLMLAIVLRDSSPDPQSAAQSEAVFASILAAGNAVFAEAEKAGFVVPGAVARTACRCGRRRV
jgi:hypothetical protein